MSDAAPGEFRLLRSLRFSPVLALDLVTSYGANVARAGSMFAIVALLGHRTPTEYLAAFLFLRSMLGFLNNVFVGSGPAAIAALRQTPAPPAEVYAQPIEQEQIDAQMPASSRRDPVSYESRIRPGMRHAPEGFEILFLASFVPAVLAMVCVYAVAPLLTDSLSTVLPYSRLWTVPAFAIAFGAGLLLRLQSDAAGGALQSRRLLWLDNLLVVSAEIIWVAASFRTGTIYRETFVAIAQFYAVSGALLFLARWLIAALLLIDWRRFALYSRPDVATKYLSVGSALAIASLGDFLYAPANFLIINRFLDPLLIADYGPALQVDQLLLLAIGALSSVILPRAVALYSNGEFARLRHAYLVATLAGVFLLASGAVIFLLFSGPLLRLWLGDVPPGTRAILPWVLVHTVVGGTAGIARAIFIAMGRLRVYTIATLGVGVINVLLALLFSVAFGWGLRGIVLATIFTVTLRNALWMPWYILRSLRTEERCALGAQARSATSC